jgi:hypothetical protein
MLGRAKRVLIYTATLLIAPIPAMPFERGTRDFALALLDCGTILILGSLYAALGEYKLKARGLLGNKILATAIITLLFGASLIIGSFAYLFLF